jgi:Chlorophyllase enzyme
LVNIYHVAVYAVAAFGLIVGHSPSSIEDMAKYFRRRLWLIVLSSLGVGLLLLPVVAVLLWTEVGPFRGADFHIELPKPTGTYGVGRQLVDWSDLSRAEPFARSRKRELMVWVWYPIGTSIPLSPGEYLPGNWGRSGARWEALELRIRSGSLWSAFFHSPISARSIERIRIHAVDDAPIAMPPPDHPAGFSVLLFSPGLGKMPTDYTAVIEDIVSHGYVVVGVNPTSFVYTTVFASGRSVGMLSQVMTHGDLDERFPIWVEDLHFVLGELTSMPKSGIWKNMDTSAVGAFGHSYGGAAALAACDLETRIAAAVDWDGTPRGEAARKEVTKPTMLVQSNHGPIDHDRGTVRFYELQRQSLRMVIGTAHHRGFSDEVDIPLPAKMRGELVGSIDGARMTRIVSAETRAFFDAWLHKEPSPLLCQQGADSTEVSVDPRFTPPFCGSTGKGANAITSSPIRQ